MAATDPQSLLEYGKCFSCYGASLVERMEIALLDKISIAVAGGVGAIFGDYGGGVPTFTPATGNGMAVDTSDGTVWYYYSGAWH